MTVKPNRPAFQAVKLDPIDARLEARAVQRGIPAMVTPKAEVQLLPVPSAPAGTEAPASPKPTAPANQATPRSRMIGVKVELPDYVWISLKKKAAEDMVPLRQVIMTALRDKGIHINDADMIEDGRRFRD
jgi:hypothetical protein